MNIQEFDFELPAERIAQRPLEKRDSSKLLLCRAPGRLGDWRGSHELAHARFSDIATELGADDFLVMNNAKVLPVRLLGHRPAAPGSKEGGAVEALLLRRLNDTDWSAIMHLSAKVKPGLEIIFEPGVVATIISTHEERIATEGEVRLRFGGIALDRIALETWLERHGHVPLPPYIERDDNADDKKTYQTVYAAKSGSAAAPTAGFHFTAELLARLEAKGVKRAAVTLHVGLGTFRPIKAERIEEHVMHEETFEISPEFLTVFAEARKEGRRLVAVGTTVVRTLESWAGICAERGIECGAPESAGTFTTRAYIHPGYRFRLVDDLITNFHLPRSTLLVLVAAALGVDQMRETYRTAIAAEYRFFSYGDAMFIRGRK